MKGYNAFLAKCAGQGQLLEVKPSFSLVLKLKSQSVSRKED